MNLSLRIKQALCNVSFAQVITYLQILSLWLLIFALPFRFGLGQGIFSRTAMIVAGAFFLFEYIINKRWETWHWTRNKWLYVAMIAFYAYIFIWHLFSDTTTPRLHRSAEQRIAFVLCGIIGLLGFNQKVKLHHIAWVFIVSALCSSWFVILHGYGWYFFTLPFTEQSTAFMLSRIQYVNAHMDYNLYLNSTLIFLLYLLLQKNISITQRVMLYCTSLWLFYILCMTEGRVGLASGLMIFSIGIFILIYQRWKLRIVAPTLLVYFLLCGYILAQHDRMRVTQIEHDPRTMIWDAGMKTVKESPILGQGVCDARNTFIEKVKANPALCSFWTPYAKHRKVESWYFIHPHNAFLEVWSEFGIIGIITLLFILLYPLFMLPKQHRLFCLLIVMCFGLQWSFDTLINPILYCLTILFFTSQSETGSENVYQKPPTTYIA